MAFHNSISVMNILHHLARSLILLAIIPLKEAVQNSR